MADMSSLSAPGVTVHYARALLQAAEGAGVALAPALVERVRRADRIPLAWQDELWEEWCARSGDRLAALRLGARVQVGHLDSAGMLLVTCATLGEALEELAAYAPLIGDGASFSLHRPSRGDGAPVHVRLEQRFAVRAVERTEAAMATLVHLARWATGDRLRPLEVRFAHAPLAPVEDYREVLGVPEVSFSTDVAALVLPGEALALPMVQANQGLRDHLRELADRTLAGLGEQGLAVRVQQVVREHPDWHRERVAEHLALSGRHLNRRLVEEGLTFKAVRERTLEELAVRWLRRGESAAGVAARLGYSDETAFARAFRRWRGTTPGRFRADDDRSPS